MKTDSYSHVLQRSYNHFQLCFFQGLCIDHKTIMGRIEQLVESRIARRRVVVFSKQSCSYSRKAKRILQMYVDDGTLPAHDLDVMEIEDLSDCDVIMDYLLTRTGGRTVPRVFVDRKFVGGADDIVTSHENGTLPSLL